MPFEPKSFTTKTGRPKRFIQTTIRDGDTGEIAYLRITCAGCLAETDGADVEAYEDLIGFDQLEEELEDDCLCQ